jgi:ATP-dependent Clp protease ATP-binding subunit ClpC
VFRLFAREQMRALLEKELADVRDRRGLRARPWAIEYDESARTFLVDRGFSPQLGARPLRRAVERYLLAPLAEAIVEQKTPTGEQFLLVSAAAGRIEVRFVDPDRDDDDATAVPQTAPEEPGAAPAARADGDVRDLALARSADAGDTRRLLARLDEVVRAVQGPLVAGRKEEALAALGRPGLLGRRRALRGALGRELPRPARGGPADRRPARPPAGALARGHRTLLVRDAVRGFRTGRLDRVLAGDFDLF